MLLTFLSLALVLLTNAAFASEAPADHLLALEGAAQYIIVLDDDAAETEHTAARELKTHLDAVTGADFPIVMGNALDTNGNPRLFVGGGKRFMNTVQDAHTLGNDGIRILTQGADIYIGGDRPRGPLYAVYAFLEDVVGVRWWTPTESHIPTLPTLTAPAQDVSYTPPIQMRETLYLNTLDPLFAARGRLNGHLHNIPAAYGGNKRIIGWCHTFFPILPPEKYFEAHPEWYTYTEGERVDWGQLCLTNEEMRAQFIENALEWISGDPEAGIISISQNDGGRRIGRACQCDNCQAVVAEEGSESGLLLRFVNAVAEAIEAEYPEFLVETLAYTYTRQPPRITRPRDNVVVRLCSYECDFSTPIADNPANEAFVRDLRDWSALSKQLFIWNYVANYGNYFIPHPNWDGLAADLRMYKEHGAIGVFEQGDATSADGDFTAMRAWLMAKLLWNPYLDQDALMREFLDGYYGAAGDRLWECIQGIREAIAQVDVKLAIYMQSTRDWLDAATVNRITQLFAEASAAVTGDAVLERRLAEARVPLDFVWVRRYEEIKEASEAADILFSGPDDPVAARDAFITRMGVLDWVSLGEGRPFSYAVPGLRNLYKEHGPVPAVLRERSPEGYLYRSAMHSDFVQGARSAALVRDKQSCSGYAVRIPAHADGHAARYYIDPGMQGHDVEDAYIRLRVDASADKGHACNVGIWDLKAGRVPPVTQVNIEDLDADGYTSVRLPREGLWAGRYISVEMQDNPEIVNAVYAEGIHVLLK